MKMLKTTVPMLLAATVLSGCSTFQEGNVRSARRLVELPGLAWVRLRAPVWLALLAWRAA